MTAACPSSQLPKRSHVKLHLMRHDLNAPMKFPPNTVTTSKYTFLTFLPLNLLEQFRRVSNMYFLIVMICTLIPGATSINPYSAVIPFMFVLAVAAVKDGLEDLKRHSADRDANAKPVHVLRDGEFVAVPSSDIQVGDVVKFRFGDEIRVQFRRVSNMYFLIVMICTLIPGATSINPYSAVIPFMFVLAVAAVKDGLEDLKRHSADRDANAKPVHVLRDGEFVEVPSSDIQVGDVVKFRFGDEIRVDGLVLNSSLPDGLAYIETANLDGETNAKTRRAKPITVEELGTIEQITARCGGGHQGQSHNSHHHFKRPSLEQNIAQHPLPENADGQSSSSCLDVHSRPNRHIAPTVVADDNEERFSTPLELPHNRNRAPSITIAPGGAPLPSVAPTTTTAAAVSNSGAVAAASNGSTEGMWSEAGGADRESRESNLSDHNNAAAAGGGLSTPIRNNVCCGAQLPTLTPPPPYTNTSHHHRHNHPISPDPFPHHHTSSNTAAHHRVGSGHFDEPSSNGVHVVCAEPNPNLALWHGKLHMPDDSIHALSIDQFVPRGCVLRNTEWVIVAALYTGNESKMMLNLRERPMKQSVMEQKVNRMNVFLFSINQAVILLFCGLGVRFRMMNMLKDGDPTTADAHHGMWYARYQMEEFGMVAMYFWRYLNLFALVSYLIPLSLYVSLEFVKATQIAYIAKDDQMAVQLPNGEFRYPRPKTSNLNVQLAHVRYIFTDKTGTLTENMMNFVGGYVGGKVFSSIEIPGGLGLELLETVHPNNNSSAEYLAASQQQRRDAANASENHQQVASEDAARKEEHAQDEQGGPPHIAGTNSDVSIPSSVNTREPTSTTIAGRAAAAAAATEASRRVGGGPTSPFTEATAFPAPPAAVGDSAATSAPQLLQTVHDLNKTVLSVILDDKGAVLLPQEICMTFDEAEVSKLAAYRYLLALSLCHNVVCFDPNPTPAAPPKSHPSSGQASAAASRAGSFRSAATKKKSHHRTISISGIGQHHHLRTTSAATSINRNGPSMSRAHSRTFSGVAMGVSQYASPASPSNNFHHQRLLSGGGAVMMHSRGPSMLPSEFGSMRPITAPPAMTVNANTKMKEKVYEGQSLDEVALVKAARDNGFQLIHRSVKQIVVDIFGTPVVYEIIADLMSIILKRDKSADHKFYNQCRSHFPPPSHHHGGTGGGDQHSRVASFESLASGSGTYPSNGAGAAAAKKQQHQQTLQQRRRVNMASFDEFAVNGPQPPSLTHSVLLPNQIGSPVPVTGAPRGGMRTFSADASSMVSGGALAEFPKIQFDRNTIGGGGRPGVETSNATPEVQGGFPTTLTSNNAKVRTVAGIHGTHTATISTDSHVDGASAPYGRGSSVSHSPTRRDPFALGNEYHGGGIGSGVPPVYNGTIHAHYQPHNNNNHHNHQDGTSSESPASTTASAAPFSNDDEYLMLTKGADSSMFAVLDQTSMYNKMQKPECTVALSEMASTGLRTLVLGYRCLTKDDVDKWLPTLHAAQTNEENRDDALHEAYAQIEHTLTIIGTTAVEDKLQDGVPETLKFLLDAEIVIWMLTGDKRETAVTIAATSGLMDPTSDICMHVDVTHMPMESDADLDAATDEVVRQLEKVKAECDKATLLQDDNSGGGGHPIGSSHSAAPGTTRVVLVIDGLSLNLILRSPERTAVFFHVGARCRSAVCCRMTPLQKADIVKLFQENTQGVALAIGDGANDVTMIQESKIGIGIMGLEGSQAELASDFAIPKFRHLKRLLCVHGRNALFRESQCVLFSVYKNVVLTCTLATYCYYTAYTGVAMMDSWTLAMWNVFFVSVPPLLMGIIDKDLDDELAETHPQLYTPLAREDMYMNGRAMLTWLIDGLVHGFFIFLLIMVAVGREALQPYHSVPMEVGGLTIYIIMVFLTNIHAACTLQMTNIFNVGGMALSFAGILSFTLAQASLKNLGGVTEMYYVAFDVYSSSYFWIYFALFNVGMLSVWNVARTYLFRDWLPENNTMVAKVAASHAWEIAKKKWAEIEKIEREHEEARLREEERQQQLHAAENNHDNRDAREWSATSGQQQQQ
ncbi:phospholipid transporting ATPase-like, putative [Bodo saltans]|uniref:Phospholipid transporting ATPase-like, putative n=1 Tax=Bodo saltans TaxID=75058 RepID=A0A0S4KNB5_BODSA|nr:phospholipid transporting ATPase-like, putative [Bodo saltans]|eukprot:CUI15104.1 phospholipid transporting ATPase-like, putative [Bodo saltans]